MKTQLLSNKELDNYKEQDTFNFIAKADAIKSFLEFSLDSLKDNKMIVLYGDWGSGKSSLMKHIESEINKTIYFPIFFKAWEHEKDDNLALSLCDAITDSLEQPNEIIKDFMKAALATLKCFASGITIKAPGVLTGLGLDAEYSVDKYIKAIDESLKDSEPVSFYKSLVEFKVKFKKVEESILEQKNATKLLIFIDDLDRCEPENVLTLITAIKLFFTYGENSVFFCGLDKDAITNAVKTKYKDVVKSNEYMEKVFDIAFNMPRTFTLKKMLSSHFFNFQLTLLNGHDLTSIDVIEDFFKSIKFTTPRHLKKVLNKYEIIKAFKNSSSVPDEFKKLIPDVIVTNKEGKVFETIFCLFMIIIYEFYLDEFEEIEDYNQKMIIYTDVFFLTRSKNDPHYSKSQASGDVTRLLYISNYNSATFADIKNMPKNNSNLSDFYGKFLYIFANANPKNLGIMYDNDLTQFSQNFTDNSISTNFCKFLIKYYDPINKECYDSRYILGNLFNMVKYLL